MSDQPVQPNVAEARTETGEIKDQSQSNTTTTETSSTQTEQKTELAKAAEPKDKSLLNKEAPSGAPETYSEFKVPEGFKLDEEVSKEASGLFKGMNLSQDQAQQLVDFYTKQTKDAFESPFKVWQETQERWQDEVKADPEIGSKLESVRSTVSKAIDGLGDPALAKSFREAMDYTGAGNNPAFIKAFYRLAQKVTEGGHVQGRGPSAEGQKRPGEGRPTAASALYPNNP